MSEEKPSISFRLLLSICGVFLIPSLGVIFTVLIFVIKDDDKLNGIKDKVDKQEISIDTLKERQERYNYQYNSRFNKLENKK